MSHQLSWSHYCKLIPLKNIDRINYYIQLVISKKLSKRELRTKIKNNEYERLDDETKNKIIINNDNKFIMEYCSDNRIYRTTYELVCV